MMTHSRDIINSPNIGLVLLSADYQVVGMNHQAKEILGLKASELGRKVHEYHPAKSRPKVGGLLSEATGSHPGTPVAMIIDVLNKVLMISISKLEVAQREQGGYWVTVLFDVTEQTGARVNSDSGRVQIKKFPIFEDGSFYFLDNADIFFIQSDGNYCRVHSQMGSHYVHLSLKHIMERYAGPEFFRVHKSFLINLRRVKKLTRDGEGLPMLVFDGGQGLTAPVARRRLVDLKRALGLA